MQRLLISLLSLGITIASFAAHIAGDGRATELLNQARAALGGESKLAHVQGLSCVGTYSREVGDQNLSGELTIDLQLPDKMLRTESMRPVGDATIIIEQGLNGEKLIRHSKTIGGGPNMVIRVPGPPPAGSDAETQALRNSRADMARTALAFLLTSPASLPVEFTYTGEAEAQEGKADVIVAKGAGSFAAQIFLDKGTHRPLMLAYRGVAPRMRVTTQGGDGHPPEAGRAAKGDQEPTAPEPLVDINLFLDDYKPVDGVTLPHHISRAIDGKTTEEWTFKSIKVNPAFKPDTFAGK